MHDFSLSHLSDASLDRGLESAARDERVATAWLLAHLAEFEARRRHLAAGFPSMHDYCVRHLRFSDGAAYKRIRVARAARQFPAIFPMIADGRLHLSGALMLAPHLTTTNAAELLAAATHRTKSEIEQLIADRFPQPDVAERIVALAPAPSPCEPGRGVELAPGRVLLTMTGQSAVSATGADAATLPPPPPEPGLSHQNASERVAPVSLGSAPGTVEAQATRSRVTPLAPERFALQCTVSKCTRDKLRLAQELLRHAVPDGNLDAVLGRALDALIERLQKRKFGAVEKPRTSRPAQSRPGANPRYIPAPVKREVWARDGGRCTFVSAAGHRCDARAMLEYDHELPFARGGTSTTDNLRLRCRAHNQHEAERTFGAEFMGQRREAAREGARAAATA